MVKQSPRKPVMEKAVFTVAEIAAQLGVSLPAAYEVAKSAGFPSFTIGKRILVSKAAFSRWLDSDAAGRTIQSYKIFKRETR
jgi:excisionase family DNA binding protein